MMVLDYSEKYKLSCSEKKLEAYDLFEKWRVEEGFL
jgi:hypothetical protein